MESRDRTAAISSHLSDDQLMEAYVLAGEDRHLAVCRQCSTRFNDLVRVLQHAREDAVREADSVFTSDALHDQRDRIMRRLERIGHPAEVVMFPSRATVQQGVHRVFAPARRWVAGAAAAGLAAGMFLGFAMDRRTHYAALDRAVRPPVSMPVAGGAWRTAALAQDEQFFSEIDAALIESRAREMRTELGAIDLMTTPAEIQEANVGLR